MVPKNWITPTVGGGVNGVGTVSARDGAGHSGQSLESLPSHHRVMHHGDKQQELGGSKQDDIS